MILRFKNSNSGSSRSDREKRKGIPPHSADSAIVRRLRRKFVTTSMISLLIIVVLMIAVINIANFSQIETSARETLDILAENEGTYPVSPSETTSDSPSEDRSDNPPQDPEGGREHSGQNNSPRSFPEMNINETSRIEAPYETRYFSVTLDAQGGILSTNVEHIAAVTEDVAQEYALTVYYNGRTEGYASSYRYRAVNTEDGGILVIFVDCSSSITEARQLMISSLAVGAAALLLMFILVWLFSGRSVQPVVESLEKQKRFISDAGHELKTPITVISANVDVLEMTGVRNNWTQSIRNQTSRMTDLINNMLTLSRMEEDSIPIEFADVDLSALVRESAATFDAVAQANHLEYSIAVRDDIHVSGDARSLRQLCTILLDNAMKYSSSSGSVYLSLRREQRVSERRGEGGRFSRQTRASNVILEVSNTCDAIPEGNLDRLFDRFYRADASRTRESRATWHVSPGSSQDHKAGTSSKAGEKKDAGSSLPASPNSSHSTGGFGIGLSVARAVVSAHGGTIRASIDGDRLIRFEVILPEKILKETVAPSVL